MLKPRLQKVIPNGVDLDIFHPGSQEKARTFLKLPLDCRIILFVSHFTVSNPWKDFQTMKAAFLDVAGRMKGEKIIFLSLGEKLPDEKITEECRIVYCPYVKDTTSLVYYYQAADMYLHAAKADTFPRVVTEATACGLPVVATSVGGIPEQVKDGETGFLVAPRCPQEMADKIVYLLENKGRRLDMGVKAAQWAQKEFGLKGHAETFLDWYQEVIGDWKRWSA
jgi:glycosyltransferase involved in cell wall biosynthesis